MICDFDFWFLILIQTFLIYNVLSSNKVNADSEEEVSVSRVPRIREIGVVNRIVTVSLPERWPKMSKNDPEVGLKNDRKVGQNVDQIRRKIIEMSTENMTENPTTTLTKDVE